MKDRLENKLTMYKAVETLLDNNSAKTTPIAALTTSITTFKGLIADIEASEAERLTTTAGKTATKREAETALIDEAVTIAAAIKALGSVTNNESLKSIGSVTKSTLVSERDTNLLRMVQGIYDNANINAVALADYGIDAAMITSLQTRMDDFSHALGLREEGVALHSAATKKVEDLFDDADKILTEQIDKMMETFRTSDTPFYDAYKDARVVRDL